MVDKKYIFFRTIIKEFLDNASMYLKSTKYIQAQYKLLYLCIPCKMLQISISYNVAEYYSRAA